MEAVYDYAAIARSMTKTEEDVCSECEGGGWVADFGPQGQGPNFRECEKCWNPDDIEKP